MRLLGILAVIGLPSALFGQKGIPRLDPLAGRDAQDTVITSAVDSALHVARTTASKKPFSECQGHAFQTCASGETVARLSVDGTAYGVLISGIYDERSGMLRTAFLWRITGRVASGGEGGGGGKGGRRGGRSRKGG